MHERVGIVIPSLYVCVYRSVCHYGSIFLYSASHYPTTKGMSLIGGACNEKLNGVFVGPGREFFADTSLFIAHELGHALGIHHDEFYKGMWY